ncbi:MAG: GHKL domain-containing protein [Eubacteriaceae bacterium]|jgi:hypothetical protein|nr:GHKL domain-containing protein [Eubacteriaceae bacterium]MDD4507411.1 GHKL domain-containing protein [Eubacteriaceae bacterium]
MSLSEIVLFVLKFYIPAAWSIIFRVYAFGYTTRGKVALGFIGYTLYVVVVPAILMKVMGYGAYTHIASIVMIIGSLAVLIFSSDTPGKTIFLQLAQGGMVTVLSVILNMIRTVCGLSYPVLLLMLAVASPIIFFIGLKYWARPLRFLVDHSQDSMRSLLALPLFTLGITSVIPVFPPQNYANHPVYCTILMVGVECSFFWYLFTMYRNLQRISSLSEQEIRSEQLRTEIHSYQTYLETARASRHDLRHHDALLLEQLENGDVKGAIAYLCTHEKEMDKASLKQFCAEPTVNAVLRIYENRCESAGIAFTATAALPKALPVSGPEIGSLLGNALENAFNAAVASGKSSAFITFTARFEDDNLLLALRNTAVGPVTFRNGVPVSKRAGGGVGTRSIANTVSKHAGIVEYSQQNQTFLTRIIVPLDEGSVE